MPFIKDRKTAVIGLILTAILWSTGGLFIKMVNGHPIAISGARAGIAALFMLFIVKFKFIPFTKNIVFGMIFYSITVIGFVTANKLTTSANAVLLQYIAPVWVAIFAAIFLKDKLRRSDFVSIAFMLFGLRLFFLDELSTGMFLGNAIAVLTSFSFAGFFIVVKTIPDQNKIYPIIYGNILSFLIGIPFFSSQLLLTPSISALLFLGIFQIGLAYVLYSKSMVYLKALDAVLIPVIEPLLNPVWVFLFIGEIPTVTTILGGFFVIASVLLRSLYQSSNKKDIKKVA
ncbi:MAG: DMT family transporter [Spirochaetales bacterium]|nr:DMT family transporter [Spirochaetales bacterium]